MYTGRFCLSHGDGCQMLEMDVVFHPSMYEGGKRNSGHFAHAQVSAVKNCARGDFLSDLID